MSILIHKKRRKTMKQYEGYLNSSVFGEICNGKGLTVEVVAGSTGISVFTLSQ